MAALTYQTTMSDQYEVVSRKVDEGLASLKVFQQVLGKILNCTAADPVKAVGKLKLNVPQGTSGMWRSCDTVQNLLLSHVISHREFFCRFKSAGSKPH